MKDDVIQCLNCRVGTLRLGKATYAQWYGRDFVLVPGVSAWRCDVCDDFAYDDDTLNRVELLLGSQLGRDKSQQDRRSASGAGGHSASDTPGKGDLSDR